MRLGHIIALAALLLGCVRPAAPASLPQDGRAVARATRWAFNSKSRARRPPGSDAYVLLLPSDQPVAQARPIAEQCVAAESFLPAPPGDPRFFFVSAGRVFSQQVADGRFGPPTWTEAGDLPLHVDQLFGFLAAASPLRLLVSARARDATENDLWLLTLADPAHATVDRLSDHPALRDQATFFATFLVPRCLAAGRRCLLVDDVPGDQRYLDVEPERGKPPQTLQQLGSLDARDAVWASRDGSQLYLLVGCPHEQ